MSRTWNDALVMQLRDLWAENHSVNKIGVILGISKNAVVGKVHRLDLPQRPSQIGSTATRTRDEKVAIIRGMIAGGQTDRQISKAMGVGHDTVDRIRVKDGGQRRPLALPCPKTTLPPLESLKDRQLVMNLLISGKANRVTAAETGLSVWTVKRIRKDLDTPLGPRAKKPILSGAAKKKKLREEGVQPDVAWKSPTNTRPFQYTRQCYSGALPTSDDVAAFIAARGVTQCPTAALAYTTGAIPDADRVALAAYREAKNAEAIAQYAGNRSRGAEATNRARGIG